MISTRVMCNGMVMGTVVQSTGGFIKEPNRWFAHQGAGNHVFVFLLTLTPPTAS
jgi:hypothetical protein